MAGTKHVEKRMLTALPPKMLKQQTHFTTVHPAIKDFQNQLKALRIPVAVLRKPM